MVLPGTFMPFFFPMGIAFMGAQSAVMMKMAGEQWQFGKRRISAMSNEDFNKLTSLKLYEIETSELRQMIPTMKQSFDDMTALNPVIVNAMIQMAKDFVQSLLNAAQSGDGLAGFIWKLIWQIPGEPGPVGLSTSEIQGPPEGPGSFDTLPSPTKEKIIPPTQEEKTKKFEDLTKDVKILDWQELVGPGKNRTQIQAAIKSFEASIKNLDLTINKQKKANQGSTATSSAIKIIRRNEAQRLVWYTSLLKYRQALTWLLKNYPKRTN